MTGIQNPPGIHLESLQMPQQDSPQSATQQLPQYPGVMKLEHHHIQNALSLLWRVWNLVMSTHQLQNWDNHRIPWTGMSIISKFEVTETNLQHLNYPIFYSLEDHMDITSNCLQWWNMIMWAPHFHQMLKAWIINNAYTLHTLGNPLNTFDTMECLITTYKIGFSTDSSLTVFLCRCAGMLKMSPCPSPSFQTTL